MYIFSDITEYVVEPATTVGSRQNSMNEEIEQEQSDGVDSERHQQHGECISWII